MFNKSRTTLVVVDLVLVEYVDGLTSVAVNDDIVVGHHPVTLAEYRARNILCPISAGISASSVMESQKLPKCTAIRSERSTASHLIHLIKK